MRLALRQSDRWSFTGFHPRLGRTDHRDPRWAPPDTHLTAYHMMPVIVLAEQAFERVSDIEIFNVYRRVEAWPERGADDPVPTISRYGMIPDLSAAGAMRQANPYFGTSFGLVVQPDGFVVPVSARGEPRALLIALHPMHGHVTDLRLVLDGEVLFEGPIEPMAYNTLSVDLPPMPQAGDLHIQFPFAKESGLPFGAAVGWLQMLTEGQIAQYDARAGQPTTPTRRRPTP